MSDIRRCFSACAVALVAFLVQLAPVSAADKVRVSLADTSDPAYLPFFVAIDKGYYRDLGLDVDVVYVGGGVATRALLAGSLEFSTSTGSAVSAILKGAALKVVMTLTDRVPWKLWATGPQTKSLQDLQGKSVGIQSHGDLFEMSMRTVLRQAGMDGDAVRYAQLGFGSGARIAAIEQGLLSAVMLTNLEERIVRERGALGKAHILVDISHTIRAPNNGLVASDRLIASNPSVVERMVRGTLMAMQYIRTQRAGALRIYAAHAPDLSPAVLRGSLDETAATYLEAGEAAKPVLDTDIAVRSSIVDVKPGAVPSSEQVYDYALVRQAAARLRADRWQPAE